MSGINDGGPVFPLATSSGANKWAQGMTLRDYFAAAALPSLVSKAVDMNHSKWKATVDHAYQIADEMIRARNFR